MESKRALHQAPLPQVQLTLTVTVVTDGKRAHLDEMVSRLLLIVRRCGAGCMGMAIGNV